jgi:hypothetical protein
MAAAGTVRRHALGSVVGVLSPDRLIYPDCARAAEASPVSAARARHLGVLASKAAQATGQFAHQVLRVEAVLLE